MQELPHKSGCCTHAKRVCVFAGQTEPQASPQRVRGWRIQHLMVENRAEIYMKSVTHGQFQNTTAADKNEELQLAFYGLSFFALFPVCHLTGYLSNIFLHIWQQVICFSISSEAAVYAFA